MSELYCCPEASEGVACDCATQPLQAENKRLREALKKYGRHLNDENQFCRSYMHSAYKCDCGFDDVLKGGAK